MILNPLVGTWRPETSFRCDHEIPWPNCFSSSQVLMFDGRRRSIAGVRNGDATFCGGPKVD